MYQMKMNITPRYQSKILRIGGREKITNYLQNYARRKKMTIAQEREKFFSETHETFVKFVLCALKFLLDEKFGR